MTPPQTLNRSQSAPGQFNTPNPYGALADAENSDLSSEEPSSTQDVRSKIKGKVSKNAKRKKTGNSSLETQDGVRSTTTIAMPDNSPATTDHNKTVDMDELAKKGCFGILWHVFNPRSQGTYKSRIKDYALWAKEHPIQALALTAGGIYSTYCAGCKIYEWYNKFFGMEETSPETSMQSVTEFDAETIAVFEEIKSAMRKALERFDIIGTVKIVKHKITKETNLIICSSDTFDGRISLQYNSFLTLVDHILHPYKDYIKQYFITEQSFFDRNKEWCTVLPGNKFDGIQQFCVLGNDCSFLHNEL